jgi:hypothetical protein
MQPDCGHMAVSRPSRRSASETPSKSVLDHVCRRQTGLPPISSKAVQFPSFQIPTIAPVRLLPDNSTHQAPTPRVGERHDVHPQ